MHPPFYKLVLPFGLALAAAALTYWTALDRLHFGVWLPDGLVRAVVVLGAVLLLAGVLRLAQWLTERDGL